MSLHNSKRIALLHLWNCISSNNLSNLSELSDGQFFLSTINSLFVEWLKDTGQCSNATVGCKDDEIHHEEVKTESLIVTTEFKDSKTDITTELKNVKTESETAEKCDQESAIELTESLDGDNKSILQRFTCIQNFINERYNLKSEEMISYSACLQADELELAKVAVFVLSEVVKHFLLVNNDQLRTLAHLDIKIQEDLAECFCLFISERENISKNEVEKILQNHAEYKVTSPPRRSPLVTPKRHCSSKYKTVSPKLSYEDVYTNSPLKSYIESPVFKKEDMILKEKEIAKTQKVLLAEELKSEEMQFELNDTKKLLKQREKEIQNLKACIKQLEASKDDLKYQLENEFSERLKSELQLQEKKHKKELESREKQFEKELELQEDDIKQQLENKISERHKNELKLQEDKHIEELELREKHYQKELASQKEEYEKKLASEKEKYEKEIKDEKEKEIGREKEISKLLTRITKLEGKIKSNCSYEDAVALKVKHEAFKWEKEKNKFEEDKEEMQQKIKEMEQTIKDLKQTIKDLKQTIKDLKQTIKDQKKETKKLQYELDVVKSNPSKNGSLYAEKLSALTQELESSVFYEKTLQSELEKAQVRTGELTKGQLIEQRNICHPNDAVNMSMPELLDISEIPDTQKLQELKKHSEKVENPNSLQDECDIPNNAVIASKHLVAPQSWDIVSFTENASGPGTEAIGALWRNSDNCELENENTDAFENLNLSEFLNFLKTFSANGSNKHASKKLENILINLNSDIDYLSSILVSMPNGSNARFTQLSKNLKFFKELLKRFSICIYPNNNTLLNKKYQNHIENENLKREDELKLQVNRMTDQLGKQIEEINKLKSECNALQKQSEELLIQLEKKNKTIEDMQIKLNTQEDRLKDCRNKQRKCEISLKDKNKECTALLNKCNDKEIELKKLKTIYKRELVKVRNSNKKLQNEVQLLSNQKEEILRNRGQKCEKKLPERKTNNGSQVNKINEELRTKNDLEQQTDVTNVRSEEYHSNYKPESFYIDLNAAVSQDIGNESTLSGALCSKNGLQFVSIDEAEFFNQSSLEDIKKDYKEDRVGELLKRNSVLPLHLQTSYPAEMDLPLSSESFYVKNMKDVEKLKRGSNPEGESDCDSYHYRKKQKLSEAECGVQSESMRTPNAKAKRTFKTPSSLKKLLQFRRSCRPCLIKPKP